MTRFLIAAFLVGSVGTAVASPQSNRAAVIKYRKDKGLSTNVRVVSARDTAGATEVLIEKKGNKAVETAYVNKKTGQVFQGPSKLVSQNRAEAIAAGEGLRGKKGRFVDPKQEGLSANGKSYRFSTKPGQGTSRKDLSDVSVKSGAEKTFVR